MTHQRNKHDQDKYKTIVIDMRAQQQQQQQQQPAPSAPPASQQVAASTSPVEPSAKEAADNHNETNAAQQPVQQQQQQQTMAGMGPPGSPPQLTVKLPLQRGAVRLPGIITQPYHINLPQVVFIQALSPTNQQVEPSSRQSPQQQQQQQQQQQSDLLNAENQPGQRHAQQQPQQTQQGTQTSPTRTTHDVATQTSLGKTQTQQQTSPNDNNSGGKRTQGKKNVASPNAYKNANSPGKKRT